MGETDKLVSVRTIVLDDAELEESKSLEELAELASEPNKTDSVETIVLDAAQDETKDIEQLAELALETDELDFEGALDLESQTETKE